MYRLIREEGRQRGHEGRGQGKHNIMTETGPGSGQEQIKSFYRLL